MIELLAAAAEAGAIVQQAREAREFRIVIIVIASWIMFYGLLPLIGGIIYGRNWRPFLAWVAALAAASGIVHAAQNILRSHNDGLFYPADQLVLFALLPALFFASLGVLLRTFWDRRAARRPAHEVQS